MFNNNGWAADYIYRNISVCFVCSVCRGSRTNTHAYTTADVTDKNWNSFFLFCFFLYLSYILKTILGCRLFLAISYRKIITKKKNFFFARHNKSLYNIRIGFFPNYIWWANVQRMMMMLGLYLMWWPSISLKLTKIKTPCTHTQIHANTPHNNNNIFPVMTPNRISFKTVHTSLSGRTKLYILFVSVVVAVYRKYAREIPNTTNAWQLPANVSQ